MTNEEAIEQLQSLIRDRHSFLDGDSEHDEIFLEDIQALMVAVSAIKDRLRWTPCSEKMPEEYEADPIQKAQRIKKVSKRLLATIVTKFDKKPHVVEARTKDGNWYVDHVDLIKPYMGEVTAWMPIPEPYKGE